MIVQDKVRDIQTSDDIRPSEFKIKASRKAFEILSAGLYSDKITAIIRELSTNAYDSHVAAGKADLPFTVHLPNTFEPYFSVKDSGIGMSPTQVNTVYTTYFDSDKTGSNDLVGCLGLGSKSPFSYTDSFTVESRFNGTQTLYNCLIGENGVPSIVKICDSVTTECNGVEIKFPVKRNDFEEFSDKAEEVLSWFKTRPNVNGNSGFSYKVIEYLSQNDKYALAKERSYNGNNYIVMGNVAYQMSMHEFNLSNRNDITPAERALLDWGITLFVGIGDIDITANREKVSYDKQTMATVISRLQLAVEDLKKEIEEKVANASNIWEARLIYNTLKTSVLGRIRNDIEVTWNGVPVDDHVNIHSEWVRHCDETEKKMLADNTLPANVKTQIDTNSYWKGSTEQRTFWATIEQLPYAESFFPTRDNKYRRRNVHDIVAKSSEKYFVNDLGRKGISYITNYCRSKNITTGYIITNVSDRLLKCTGLEFALIKASTLPAPVRNTTAKVSGPKGPHTVLNEVVDGKTWSSSEADIDEGGIYVEKSYSSWKMNDKDTSHTANHLSWLVNQLQGLTDDDTISVYGVRSADVPKLKKSQGDWIHLSEYVQSVVEENKDLDSLIKLRMIWNNFSFGKYASLDPKKFGSGPFHDFLSKIQKAKESAHNGKLNYYIAIKEYIDPNLKTQTLPDGESLNDLYSKMTEKYPLLEHLNWWNADDEITQHMADYITLIDARNAVEEAA